MCIKNNIPKTDYGDGLMGRSDGFKVLYINIS